MSRELEVGAREVVLRERGQVLAREPFGSEDVTLPAALQRLPPQRIASSVIANIAASHARMLLLPWLPQLTRPERWLSLAASRFEQTFGEPPDGWVLRVAEDLPPRARLAAAIPDALVKSLRTVGKLRAVRIGLLEALGALLEREPAFNGCVAQIGDGSACLLMLCRGELRRVRMRRFDAAEELAIAARSEWAVTRATESDRPAAAVSLAVVGKDDGAAVQLKRALDCTRVLEFA